MKKRWLSFPTHVHRVSAMVFVRAITIPTLCKSIIERETYDHFSSVYVACALDPLVFFAVVTSSFLLSLSLYSSSFLYTITHSSNIRCRVQSTLFFTSDFVSHPFSSCCSFLLLLFLCQI
jgi:hypothetical protein